MFYIIKNPDNYIVRDNTIYQVREKQITCDDCPNCFYYESFGTGEKIKVSKCIDHIKVSKQVR